MSPTVEMKKGTDLYNAASSLSDMDLKLAIVGGRPAFLATCMTSSPEIALFPERF